MPQEAAKAKCSLCGALYQEPIYLERNEMDYKEDNFITRVPELAATGNIIGERKNI